MFSFTMTIIKHKWEPALIMRPILTVALLSSLFILVGCGIKGSLYLPDVPQAPPGEMPTIPSQTDGDDSKPENLQTP